MLVVRIVSQRAKERKTENGRYLRVAVTFGGGGGQVCELYGTTFTETKNLVRNNGYLTIILRGRAGYRMIDNQRGA